MKEENHIVVFLPTFPGKESTLLLCFNETFIMNENEIKTNVLIIQYNIRKSFFCYENVLVLLAKA